MTCAAVTRITAQLKAQYGLVSAGAFPPHATLAGSLPVQVSEAAFGRALARVLATVRAFPVQNSGIRRLGTGVIVYDLHDLDDRPNTRLRELAATVDAVVRPLLAPTSSLAPDTYAPGRWRAHLSLASHELYERSDLRDEVEQYVRGLAIEHPRSFVADTVALYRFTEDSWTGQWWRTMRWEHLRSWRLRSD